MSILTILEYPDKRLRTIASPIDSIDANITRLIDDMFETMYEAPGIGLAATQVNQHKQLLVLDISEDKSQPMVFINPVITAHQGSQIYQEGCLSLPNIYADVKRFDQITVSAMDRHGKNFVTEADGLLAICIQHEMDHLIGKVFVDHLSPLKRALAEKKLAKQRKLNAEEA
ncbi:MAG TPA: peptide deformylase [Arenimonas sp.]|nr:peptide deformylase [Arenimonas sp.]